MPPSKKRKGNADRKKKHCVPGAHNVKSSNVHAHKITPELVGPYKQCCLIKRNPNDEIDADQEVQVCTSCWVIIDRERRHPTQPVYSAERTNYFPYKIPVIEENKCFLCSAENPQFLIPFQAKVEFYLKTDMFIPHNTKCCRQHLTTDEKGFRLQPSLFEVNAVDDVVAMKPPETARWFRAIRKFATTGVSGMVQRILALEDEDFRQITALKLDEFHALCSDVCEYSFHGLVCRPVSVMLLLMKLRNANYLNFLKALFGFRNKGTVSLQIRVARKAIMDRFVPRKLGPQAFPRPAALEHMNELARNLHLSPDNNENVVITIDGTYVYIPKSSNFTLLKRSYSQHKGRHLVKMTMAVLPNGKIVDVHGPYLCDAKNNDASTLRHNLSQDGSRLKGWLIPGDVIVVDRGYRDAVEFLEGLGFQVAIPHCLPSGVKQHPTKQANESRIVTKTRWIVECMNGHVSQIFKFFGRTIHAGNVPFIGDYFRIACALINAFYPPIIPSQRSIDAGNRMLRLKDSSNVLMEYLAANELLDFRRLSPWRDMTELELEEFPRMSLDDLYDLALGVFQIRMAPSYHGGQDSYRFKVYKHEDTLLRVKLWSRHSPSIQYYVFIRFVPDGRGSDSILGWYCSCKTGARTVGMCSHICTILWYLCFARYEPEVRVPSSRNLDIILDAAERHRNLNVVPDAEGVCDYYYICTTSYVLSRVRRM